MRLTTLLLIILLALPIASEAVPAEVKEWQASIVVNYPKENLEFNLLLVNNGHEKIEGIEFEINAPYADYIKESDIITPETFNVKVGSNDGQSNIRVIFDKPLEKDTSKLLLFKISCEGLTRKTKEAYTAIIKFSQPKVILEGGNTTNLNISSGVFKIHLPVGDLPVGYEPAPWREIWQGVSGFEDHFVAIYDSTPFTQEIKITFKEEPLLREIIEADNDVEKLVYEAGLKEKKGEDTTVAEAYIDKAKIALGKAIDSLLAQDKENAETELKAAKRYINTAQTTLGIKETTTTAETETKKETPTPSYTGLQGISKYAIFSTIFFGLVVLAFVGSYVIGTLGVEEEEED